MLDNLREGVLAPDIYDPTLNPLYRDVLAALRRGRAALPHGEIRIEKARSNRGVGHAQENAAEGPPLRKPRGSPGYLDRWEARWADTRIHGTTKRQVAAMFAEERPALLPLPLEPFRYYQYGERTVHLDGCVEVEAAYYGAPPGWIGRRVQVQWDGLHVRLLDPQTGPAAARTLTAAARGPSHQRRGPPQDKRRSARSSCCARADKAGPQHRRALPQMHAERGETAVRRILGVLVAGQEVRRRQRR